MKTTHTIVVLAGSALLVSMQTTSAFAQRGAGVRGGGGGGTGPAIGRLPCTRCGPEFECRPIDESSGRG